MKSAKLFLIGMYVHLFLSIIIPISILYFCFDGWDILGIGLLLFYLFMIVVVQIMGCVCFVMAIDAYRKNEWDKLFSGWEKLKLGAIPFYVINFLYSFIAWFILVGASRGILILLVPIPIIITCLMIVQSGGVGIFYIMYLRKHLEYNKRPSNIHYIMQVLSVFDIISTIIILKKYNIK